MTRLAMAALTAALVTTAPAAAASWTVTFPTLTFSSDIASPADTAPTTRDSTLQTRR